jgi:hypothetical protein
VTLVIFESSIVINIRGVSEGIFELAEVFEESREHQCLLVLVDGYLSNLENEVQQKQGHFLNVVAENLENVSQFLCRNFDEVELPSLIRLYSDEILAL